MKFFMAGQENGVLLEPAHVVTSLKQLPVLKGHLGTIVIVW
jgi:hypothetical protein